MTAALYSLQRHHDVTGVSGEGAVATIVEFQSGLLAMHWDTDTPSVTVYSDIRHIEKLHGHAGASTLHLLEPHRLVSGYPPVCFWLTRKMNPDRLPLTLGPHPDWPDRLLMRVEPTALDFWIALFDGSPSACTHKEVR